MSNYFLLIAVETAATKTKPAVAGCQVHAGGLCLCSRGFNRRIFVKHPLTFNLKRACQPKPTHPYSILPKLLLLPPHLSPLKPNSISGIRTSKVSTSCNRIGKVGF